MREPLARLRIVQTESTVQRAAHVGFAPLGMPDKRPALDALRERASVGFALAPRFGLQAMQLAAMPPQGRDADQPGGIGRRVASYRAVRQRPRVHTMRVPDLCQLLPRLLEAQLLT